MPNGEVTKQVMNHDRKKGWSIDLTFNPAVIITMLTQVVAVVWWMAVNDTKLETFGNRLDEQARITDNIRTIIEARSERRDQDFAAVSRQVSSLESSVNAILRSVARIESQIDKRP